MIFTFNFENDTQRFKPFNAYIHLISAMYKSESKLLNVYSEYT